MHHITGNHLYGLQIGKARQMATWLDPPSVISPATPLPVVFIAQSRDSLGPHKQPRHTELLDQVRTFSLSPNDLRESMKIVLHLSILR